MPDTPTAVPDAAPALKALDVVEVSTLVGYSPRYIRQLTRRGEFPQPIDIDRSARSWRWSSTVIGSYLAGEWVAA